jgi:Tfp pilus assembly protein FimT
VKNSLPCKTVIDSKGVILLDLLIVAIILAIMGMIAIPLFSSFIADNKLEGSTGELVTGLQYAGNLAVQYQRPFAVSADVAGNWFKVFDMSPAPNSTPPARPDNIPPVDENGVVLNPFDKTWYVMDFDTIDLYRGVKIVSVPSGGTVQFYPDGHSGIVDSVFSISYGGKQKTITVNGTTGLITVQ